MYKTMYSRNYSVKLEDEEDEACNEAHLENINSNNNETYENKFRMVNVKFIEEKEDNLFEDVLNDKYISKVSNCNNYVRSCGEDSHEPGADMLTHNRNCFKYDCETDYNFHATPTTNDNINNNNKHLPINNTNILNNNTNDLNSSNNNNDNNDIGKGIINQYYNREYYQQRHNRNTINRPAKEEPNMNENMNFCSGNRPSCSGIQSNRNHNNYNFDQRNTRKQYNSNNHYPVYPLQEQNRDENIDQIRCSTSKNHSGMELLDRIKRLSISEFRRETNRCPMPPPTPILSPLPSFTPPPYRISSSNPQMYPETPYTNQAHHKNNGYRFYKDDGNMNFNCSKSANCDSDSDNSSKRSLKRYSKKRKNLKNLRKNNKRFSYAKFNKNFEEKAHLKNMVVSGMATHKLYKGLKSQKNNTNSSNSIRKKSTFVRGRNMPRDKPCLLRRTQLREQSPNSVFFNESVSNNRINKRIASACKTFGEWDWEQNKPSYLNRNMHHMTENIDVSDEDSSKSNDAYERYKPTDHHENDFSSESVVFPKKVVKSKLLKVSNKSGNHQHSDSNISVDERDVSYNSEYDEEKLKIASAVLLMGKYSKRKDFPLDDVTYVQGSKRVMQFLHQLWLEQTTCDFTIICDGGNVLTHQFIMSAWSPTLESVFKQQCMEFDRDEDPVTINMTDYPRDIVADVINFLYTTDIKLELSTVGVVVAVCRDLDITTLVNVCEDFLIKTATVDAVLLHYSVAANNNLKFAKAGLAKVIGSSISEVSNNKYFCYLPYDRLYSLLTNTNTCGTEIDIFLVLVKWIDFNRKERLKHSNDLLSLVRFQHITLDDLTNGVDQVKWIFVDKESKDLLLQAFRYHAMKMKGSSMPMDFKEDVPRCAAFKKKKPLDASLGEFCEEYQEKVNKCTVDMNEEKRTGQWDKMEVMMKNPGMTDGNFLGNIPESSEIVITGGWSADQTNVQSTPTVRNNQNTFKVITNPPKEVQQCKVNDRFRDFVKNTKTSKPPNVPNPLFATSKETHYNVFEDGYSQHVIPAVNSVTYDRGMIERIRAAHINTRSDNKSQSNRNGYSEDVSNEPMSPLRHLENNLKSLQDSFRSERDSMDSSMI